MIKAQLWTISNTLLNSMLNLGSTENVYNYQIIFKVYFYALTYLFPTPQHSLVNPSVKELPRLPMQPPHQVGLGVWELQVGTPLPMPLLYWAVPTHSPAQRPRDHSEYLTNIEHFQDSSLVSNDKINEVVFPICSFSTPSFSQPQFSQTIVGSI